MHASLRIGIAARYTEYHGTSGNVFERQVAEEGRPSTVFNNSKNWASSSQRIDEYASPITTLAVLPIRHQTQ